MQDTQGQHVYCILLGKAKGDGYENSNGYGKRLEWLKEGCEDRFFIPGGKLHEYKSVRFGSLRKKLGQAESHARSFLTVGHKIAIHQTIMRIYPLM